MKLLFDQNLSFRLCDQLADLFPHSSQTGVLGLGRADDLTVWEAARKGDFVLVTQDSDFAEIAALRGAPPKVIWLRCGNQSTSFFVDLLRRRAAAIAAFQADVLTACLEVY